MPCLVKTHETATSAFFRFDFNSDNIRIWKKDGTMTRTNSTDSIQDGVSYYYSDLFADGAERTFYVQVLEPGAHGIEVKYMLDNHELDSKDISFTFAELKIKCNDVFTNSITVNVGQKISLEASFEPDVFDNVVFQWDIPGYNNFTPDVIKNYITTAEQGTVETLEWNDFDESTVDFYWVKAVTNNVECIATVDGEDYTRTISFSVQKPTCSFTSSLTTNIPPVGVRTNFFPPVPELVYGSQHISQGITFYPEVTTGDTGSGTIALFQLISLDIESLGTETFVCSSENNYIIDSVASSYGISILYGGYETMVANNETKMHTNPNSEYISNSPAIRFDTFELQIETYVPIADANIYHVSRHDDFKIYVMYKPSSDNSIWIPLSKMTWLWGGQASKGTNEIWTLDAGSGNSLSVAPIGYDTLEFPVWTRNFQDEVQDITIK